MQLQKISKLPQQMGLEFPGRGGGGSVRTKNFKKCMKLNLEFPDGYRVLKKIPFMRGMIFYGLHNNRSAVP